MKKKRKKHKIKIDFQKGQKNNNRVVYEKHNKKVEYPYYSY